jgi:WD40 repeat protein
MRRTLQTPGWVLALAFSPDGKTLAFSRTDSTVLLWDVSSGNVCHTFREHTRNVYALAWSPDGKTVASAGEDATVQLWDAATEKPLHSLAGHTGTVNALAWSPDGKAVASASHDATVRLWDAASGKPQEAPLKHPQAVHVVAWSPDGRTLATGSADFVVRLWDAATGELRATLAAHTRAVWSLTWSPDSKTLFSSGDDQVMRSWEVTRETPLRIRRRWGRAGEPHALTGRLGRFSPDGQLFAAGEANALRLWVTGSGQRCRTLVVLGDEAYLALDAVGHYGRSAATEPDLVVVVQTDTGQVLLPPEEFAAKFGWINDPDRVRLRR